MHNEIVAQRRGANREYEMPNISFTWKELKEGGVETHVMAGGSLLVLGPPGCGKSFLMQKLVEKLRAQGNIVAVISKCWVAARRADPNGQTADHFCRRVLHGSCKAGVIWIDRLFSLESAQ